MQAPRRIPNIYDFKFMIKFKYAIVQRRNLYVFGLQKLRKNLSDLPGGAFVAVLIAPRYATPTGTIVVSPKSHNSAQSYLHSVKWMNDCTLHA